MKAARHQTPATNRNDKSSDAQEPPIIYFLKTPLFSLDFILYNYTNGLNKAKQMALVSLYFTVVTKNIRNF